MENEKILMKIKKLLNLSLSGNKNESQAAMLKAQELMVTYDITEKDINDVNLLNKKEKITEIFTKIKATTRMPWWYKVLGNIIAQNFRCFSVITQFRPESGKKFSSSKIKFIGKEIDCEIASEVFIYAILCIDTCFKNYIDLNKSLAKKASIKNTYISGFLNGLQDKFKEQINNNSWGLVVVKSTDLINYFKSKNTYSAKQSGIQPGFSENENVNSAGYLDGKKFGAGCTNKKIGD